MDNTFVTYEQFGARGDGFTDDFLAIYKAHEYANEHKLPVVTDDGKTYYIRNTLIDGEARAAVIKTDVNWGTSKFIIDDSDLDYFDGTRRALGDIFHIASDYEKQVVTDREILDRLSGIGEGTKKIALALSYPAMIVIYNEHHEVFKRYGSTYSGAGNAQQELIVVDGEGNVDPSTPFMFNYEEVTKLVIYRTDITPITIKGGIFTTRASHINIIKEDGRKSGYFYRGLLINRSHTTLDGVEHYVTGEITTYEHRDKDMRGPHYAGFYRAAYADEVTLKNCVMTGRRYYYVSGTYEFNGEMVNKIYLINCTQSNFWIEDEEGNKVVSMATSPVSNTLYCWGVGGTNFCKNMEYHGCTISRFDAHQGLYNGKIIDSTLNYMELTGKGDLLFENLTWYAPPKYAANTLALLRGDYGSTWEGTITFKNCVANINGRQGDFYLTAHNYVNWNFGYTCYFPNFVVDNLEIRGLGEGARVQVVTCGNSMGREPNLHLKTTAKVAAKREGVDNDMTNDNPIVPPKFIKVLNNKQGIEYHIPKCDFFASTEKVGLTEDEI